MRVEARRQVGVSKRIECLAEQGWAKNARDGKCTCQPGEGQGGLEDRWIVPREETEKQRNVQHGLRRLATSIIMGLVRSVKGSVRTECRLP